MISSQTKLAIMLLKSWIKRYSFLIATFLAWLILCVPQNVVTLVMYFDPQDFQDSRTQKNFTCYESHQTLMKNLEFWVLGVTVTVLGSCGILSNLFSILILQRLATKSSFNRLLLGVGNYQGFQIASDEVRLVFMAGQNIIFLTNLLSFFCNAQFSNSVKRGIKCLLLCIGPLYY